MNFLKFFCSVFLFLNIAFVMAGDQFVTSFMSMSGYEIMSIRVADFETFINVEENQKKLFNAFIKYKENLNPNDENAFMKKVFFTDKMTYLTSEHIGKITVLTPELFTLLNSNLRNHLSDTVFTAFFTLDNLKKIKNLRINFFKEYRSEPLSERELHFLCAFLKTKETQLEYFEYCYENYSDLIMNREFLVPIEKILDFDVVTPELFCMFSFHVINKEKESLVREKIKKFLTTLSEQENSEKLSKHENLREALVSSIWKFSTKFNEPYNMAFFKKYKLEILLNEDEKKRLETNSFSSGLLSFSLAALSGLAIGLFASHLIKKHRQKEAINAFFQRNPNHKFMVKTFNIKPFKA